MRGIDYWVMLVLLFGGSGIGVADGSTSSFARGGKDDERGKSAIKLYGRGKAHCAEDSEAICAKDTRAATTEVGLAAIFAPDPAGEAEFAFFDDFLTDCGTFKKIALGR